MGAGLFQYSWRSEISVGIRVHFEELLTTWKKPRLFVQYLTKYIYMTYNSPSVQYIGMLHIYQMLDSFLYEEK